MKIRILLFLLIAFSGKLSAENDGVGISCEWNESSSSYNFVVDEISGRIPVTVFLKIWNTKNCSNSQISESQPFMAVVKSPGQIILRLRPTDPNQPVDFKWGFDAYEGDFRSHPDTSFVYLVPLKEGLHTKTNYTYRDDTIVGCWFGLHGADTVYAARKGEVVHIEPPVASIDVYHKDGTCACYYMDGPITPLVKEGDEVQANTPLFSVNANSLKQYSLSVIVSGVFKYAKSSKESSEELDVASLKVKSDGFRKKRSADDWQMKRWMAFPVKFFINGKAGYVEDQTAFDVERPDELVTLEMSKRARKKYFKAKGKKI